jgi:hypothetical protein
VKAIVLDINSPGGGVFGVPKSPISSDRHAQEADHRRQRTRWRRRRRTGSHRGIELVVTPSGPGRIDRRVLDSRRPLEELADAGVSVSLIRPASSKPRTTRSDRSPKRRGSAIQERVDAYFSMFTRDVARGRGVAIDAVRNGFGEGRVVNAKRRSR